ncbi:globin [Bradyrhizobium sp. 2S1]|uniref:globin n=1 Tax=Bradyrhizobium sp. 2S1 TaxID=1404429 RepID=UPI0020059635|nr:globin [Bradyrhizobium sp. 2S1]MCK7673420.1 globin [Bradyrhizobium sp. 2S1]
MKVLDMITALVASLDERPMFQSLITLSGHKHARLGVQPSHFVAMGEALMWSFDCKFGPSYPRAEGIVADALRHRPERDAARGRPAEFVLTTAGEKPNS